jgi:hypothetical protein
MVFTINIAFINFILITFITIRIIAIIYKSIIAKYNFMHLSKLTMCQVH